MKTPIKNLIHTTDTIKSQSERMEALFTVRENGAQIRLPSSNTDDNSDDNTDENRRTHDNNNELKYVNKERETSDKNGDNSLRSHKIKNWEKENYNLHFHSINDNLENTHTNKLSAMLNESEGHRPNDHNNRNEENQRDNPRFHSIVDSLEKKLSLISESKVRSNHLNNENEEKISDSTHHNSQHDHMQNAIKNMHLLAKNQNGLTNEDEEETNRFHSINANLKSKHKGAILTENNRFVPSDLVNENNKSDQKLSDRQMERFHGSTTDDTTNLGDSENLKNRLYKSKDNLENEERINTEKQGEFMHRLTMSKGKLHHLPVTEQKIERFRHIEQQLLALEKEIEDLDSDDKLIKTRFHSDNNTEDSQIEKDSSNELENIPEENSGKKELIYKKVVLTPLDVEEPSIADRDGDDDIYKRHAHKKRNKALVDGSEMIVQYSKSKVVPLSVLDSKQSHHFMDSQQLNFINVTEIQKKSKSRPKVKRSVKRRRKSKKHRLKRRKKMERNAVKREFDQGKKRTDSGTADHGMSYVIMTITSDLNAGEEFMIVNVKLPKNKKFQRACFEKMVSSISNVNSESEKKMNVLIMGDFHLDRLTGSDDKGELFKMITNLQIDGENFHSPITYSDKDPISTVYGRRYDNILSNIHFQGNLKAIGPDFPIEPEAVIMPLTLQRLYNNYMTSLYTTDSDESDKIYECLKAFQLAGRGELDNVVCKDSWVPSSYISDHLPLQFKITKDEPGKAAPVVIKMTSWNLQGDTFKERLLDPAVKKGFLAALKNYHVAVFHEFPPHDRILDDEELGSSKYMNCFFF